MDERSLAEINQLIINYTYFINQFEDAFQFLQTLPRTNGKDQNGEDGQSLLRKFVTFFKLGPKNYFGGRVLIAESSVTTEGKT